MALPNYGTNTTLDTLAASYQTVAKFGEDKAWDAIAQSLEAHNRIMSSMMGALVVRTSDRLRRYGSAARMKMVELDEFGTADVQKIIAGVPCGFPMKLFGETLGWTRRYFLNARSSEIAAQFTAAQDADAINMINQIKLAIFRATNYMFEDRLVDHLQQIQLPVKAFLNADGAPIPVGPNGEIFDGTTHTHYFGSATLTDAFLKAVIETVLEHYRNGKPLLYINRADENAVRGLSSFIPYLQAGVRPSLTTVYSETNTLDMVDIYNRAIGTYDGAEVWVKPWMIPTYYFATIQGQPQPIVMRVRGDYAGDGTPMDGAGELILSFDDEAHPLRARGYEREFGMAVWNRTNGAIGNVNANGLYNVPVIQ